MPTYQYACPDCGLEFERQQKFTDEPIKRCPKCGKKHVYRVVSKVAVTFKGSGWYITDSKNDAAKRAAETKSHETPDKASAKAEEKAPVDGKGEAEEPVKSKAVESSSDEKASKTRPAKKSD